MKYLLTYESYVLKYKYKNLDIETETIIESIINNKVETEVIDSKDNSYSETLVVSNS